MANPNGPRGFTVTNALGGGSGFVKRFAVDTGTAIIAYPGDLAEIDTDGVANVLGAQSDDYAGPIVGIYNSDKQPVSSLAASTAGYFDINIDPGIIMICQVGDGGTALTSAAVGDAADAIWTHAGSGSRAGVELDASLAGDGAAAQFRILGLVETPDNTWGANCKVYVTALEHAFNSTPNAI